MQQQSNTVHTFVRIAARALGNFKERQGLKVRASLGGDSILRSGVHVREVSEHDERGLAVLIAFQFLGAFQFAKIDFAVRVSTSKLVKFYFQHCKRRFTQLIGYLTAYSWKIKNNLYSGTGIHTREGAHMVPVCGAPRRRPCSAARGEGIASRFCEIPSPVCVSFRFRTAISDDRAENAPAEESSGPLQILSTTYIQYNTIN